MTLIDNLPEELFDQASSMIHFYFTASHLIGILNAIRYPSSLYRLDGCASLTGGRYEQT